MTRDELLTLHAETCRRARQIMEAKNQDYTGGADDPFANFRVSEMLGVDGRLGILLRVVDKMQRVRSFIVRGALAVKSESVDDAIDDIINYMILLKGMIDESRRSNS